MILPNTFQFHVDASYYGFQWPGDQYIEVEYSAIVNKGVVGPVSVTSVKGTPYLMASIGIHNSWVDVNKEITEAAKDHAQKEFGNDHVHPVMMTAIAPHINY
jgi:hypothetical protein